MGNPSREIHGVFDASIGGSSVERRDSGGGRRSSVAGLVREGLAVRSMAMASRSACDPGGGGRQVELEVLAP